METRRTPRTNTKNARGIFKDSGRVEGRKSKGKSNRGLDNNHKYNA
jgi:hypothetical protein